MEAMQVPLIVYALTVAILLVSGFVTLFWMSKTRALAEL